MPQVTMTDEQFRLYQAAPKMLEAIRGIRLLSETDGFESDIRKICDTAMRMAGSQPEQPDGVKTPVASYYDQRPSWNPETSFFRSFRP